LFNLGYTVTKKVVPVVSLLRFRASFRTAQRTNRFGL
jgi:hypothetical protein